MKNALRIGSVAGIGIYLHWTFLVLVVGLFAFYLYGSQDLITALSGIGLILALFGCVVLHELGHALTARRFSVPTRDITLYPIGGVARLARLPDEPAKEFWIAIAGPAVNLAIAAVLFATIVAVGRLPSVGALMDPHGNALDSLLWMNVALAVFNMLPAFPMDGGRVLRALLATRLEYSRATQIAANVGQWMAILFGILGIVIFNPILLFIALFVYVGAQQEAQQALLRTATQGVSVRQAMMTRYQTLDPDDRLTVAIDALLAGAEHEFPVLDKGQVIGVLTRKALLAALAERGADARVGDVVRAGTVLLEDNQMLDEAFAEMHQAGLSAVPVLRQGSLVGVLTLENVGEYMMISAALRKAGDGSEARSRTSSLTSR